MSKRCAESAETHCRVVVFLSTVSVTEDGGVMERMRVVKGVSRDTAGEEKEEEDASQLSGFNVRVGTLNGNQVTI